MNKPFFVIALLLLCAAGAKAQGFSLSTNFVDYANLGTLNLSADYSPARHWSIGAGVKYNPYTYRQRSCSVNTKFWPWHSFSGWWVSANVRIQEYNSGGYSVRRDNNGQTSEGDRYGGGLSAGFSYMLSKHLNLDIGAGIWAGREVYTVYSCPSCGRVIESGKKTFILPSDITLALSFLF